MAKKKVRVFWFVEPLDANTNKVIAQELAEEAEERKMRNLICQDGKRHNLWQCPFRLIQRLFLSQETLHLKFKVYTRQGSHGKIRPAFQHILDKAKTA